MENNTKVKEVIVDILLKQSEHAFEINFDDDLAEYGMTSISFMKLIVAIEEKFDFIFDDDALDQDNYHNFNELANYVAENAQVE